MSNTQADSKPENAKWPFGVNFYNRAPERDDDSDGNERITPPGSIWVVTDVDHKAGVYSLSCAETGAWIFPDEDALRTQFSDIV